MELRTALEALRELAPEHLAEPWDKVGLQVGDSRWPVRRALLAIDLTPAVLAEAKALRCQLIVAYHPPIFAPLTAVTTATWRQQIVLEAAASRIAVYSPHTALDAAVGGINDWLASGLGKGNIRPIQPALPAAGKVQFKLVVFVPSAHAERLRIALSRAGAGALGNYSECSFASPGEGTFRPGRGSHPAVGRPGRLERAPELRMEMLCPADRLPEAIAALRQSHPYEEPAFDVFRSESVLSVQPGDSGRESGGSAQNVVPQAGGGRILELTKPVTWQALAAQVKRRLGLLRIQIAHPAKAGAVRRVAICVGAGGSLLHEALNLGAQAFVTGEMRHHDLMDAHQQGLCVILGGHTETERPYLAVYRRRLVKRVPAVDWRLSRADRPPAAG